MTIVKNIFSACILLLFWFNTHAQDLQVSSPDGKLTVQLKLNQGKLFYQVSLDGQQMLTDSPLGIRGAGADLSQQLQLESKASRQIDQTYQEPKIKKSSVHYQANEQGL